MARNDRSSYQLEEWTTQHLEQALFECKSKSQPAILLLPLGSVEPHGPHLPLATDRLLSEENAQRALTELRTQQVHAWIAPSLAYGVTEYAQGFCGAISLSQKLYEQLLTEISEQYFEAGFTVICWINHHLEPLQLQAIQQAASVLNQKNSHKKILTPSVVSRRWGRDLGAEFKSGACHAGEYESSMILNAHPHLVDRAQAQALPHLEISLSAAIRQGRSGFLDIGMDQAYTGSPATATAEEGERLFQAHTNMVVSEVLEAIQELNTQYENK